MVAASRVLLVDDEPKIVDALQRLLRPLRATWSVSTATSARAALELLDRETFDVVVSDMRMPEMDGASFLAIVKEKFPATARIILSGQTEKSAAFRALPVAHQFLQKPCPPSALIEILTRRTQFPLSDAALRRRIGGIDALPCDPATAGALSALVGDGKVRLSELSELVESEPALILKLLQLTGSSFFGISRRTDDVSSALSLAGDELLQTLASSTRETASIPASKHFDLQAFRAHALHVANAMSRAASGSPNDHTWFAAGMLHDIGKIVIATYAPDQFDAVTARAAAEGISFEHAELAEGVESHSRVGAALLDLWGLPQSIVSAVAHQNETNITDPAEREVTTAIQIAHRLESGP